MNITFLLARPEMWYLERFFRPFFEIQDHSTCSNVLEKRNVCHVKLLS